MSKEDYVDVEYLQAVGTLTLYAALTDAILFSAFVVTSGIEVQIARAIYYALDAMPTKKTMVNRVLNVVSKDSKPIVQEIMEAVDKAHGKRNELAHAVVMYDEESKGALRYSAKDQQQPYRPITEAYLRSLLAPALAATTEATDAYRRLCKKLGVPDRLHLECGCCKSLAAFHRQVCGVLAQDALAFL